MQSKTPSKSLIKAAVLPVALVLFLSSQGVLKAQALYANLGPASFSRNWGAQGSSPYQPEEVQQRVTRTRVTTATIATSYPTSSLAREIQDAAATPDLPGNNSLTQPTIAGNRAVLRHGIAYAPANAPLCVKKAIWATNTLLRKPYVWGGGHDSFFDPRGYDCSGTVSFALHYAGQLGSPTDSRSLMSFGEPGPGRWMTVFARDGHTWMIIAGLRLDTTGFYGNEGPRWRPDGRSGWGFTERHPVGL
jgi:cell wall-associated NlpC family hydrolase